MNVVFKLYAVIIGFVSTLHMVWVFYSESVLGHRWTFYETNIPLAYTEFGMALSGAVLLFAYFVQLVPGPSQTIHHKLTPRERLSLGLKLQ
jgi:hypothetical protein